MKKLLFVLLLLSPFSFADWGDVYYCEEISRSSTTLSGKLTSLSLDKFSFKLDKALGAMVFDKKGRFSLTKKMLLRKDMHWPSEEKWFATKMDDSWFEIVFLKTVNLYSQSQVIRVLKPFWLIVKNIK